MAPFRLRLLKVCIARMGKGRSRLGSQTANEFTDCLLVFLYSCCGLGLVLLNTDHKDGDAVK